MLRGPRPLPPGPPMLSVPACTTLRADPDFMSMESAAPKSIALRPRATCAEATALPMLVRKRRTSPLQTLFH